MIGALEETAVRRFTVEEYYRLAEVGVIAPEERVELIEGIICKMSPEGKPHVAAIELALDVLNARLKGRHRARSQHPLHVSDDTEPQPDVAVVESADPRAYLAEHPRSALLVIEVAQASLKRDLNVKPGLYARAGVREYWVESLVDETLHVFRDPAGDEYRTRLTLRRGDKVSLVALPDVEMEVSDLLP